MTGQHDPERMLQQAREAREAAASRAQKASAALRHAQALRGVGRYRDAAGAMEAARALAPEDHVIAWNAALEMIRHGDWAGGLRAFGKHRVHDRELLKANVLRPFRFQEWDGEPLAASALLAYAEQGVGDQIMQARAIPNLAGNARQLVVECNRRLIPLFERSFAGPSAVQYARQSTGSAERLNAQPFDTVTSLLLVWQYLDPPQWNPAPAYLTPDPDLATNFQAQWRGQNMGPNIGLSWRSVAPGHGMLRSIPLELTRPWRDGRTFHSLQYDATPQELEAEGAASGHPLVWDREGDAKADLDRLAARIASLDLVITIDNTIAHIAGAVGTPCWVLLPLASDWRWGRPEAEHRLYESVRLFWNDHPTDWSGIQDTVTAALTAHTR